MFSLVRERDGAGDSGGMSQIIYEGSDGKAIIEDNARPRVGVGMRVGTYKSRTMSNQDWWQTTIITEIIEESDNYVKFRTGNSVYEWKVF